MSALVARARGLQGRLLRERALAEIERVSDLVVLARWARDDELLALELDEDRYSVRAIVRGLAGGVPAERRRLATTPTARLPARALARLAESRSLGELADGLRALHHPLAPVLAVDDDAAIDVLAIELALANRYAELATAAARDRAMRSYVAQRIDGDNATTAVLLAARGGVLPRAEHFIAGGELLSREAFLAITSENVHDVLADVFANTPLATGITDDAILAWQLATQRALRRHEPHGLAAVIYVVLCGRREVRRLRRAAWRLALGGAG